MLCFVKVNSNYFSKCIKTILIIKFVWIKINRLVIIMLCVNLIYLKYNIKSESIQYTVLICIYIVFRITITYIFNSQTFC